MLLTGRFRRTSLWIWNSPARGPLRVFVRPDRPSLVERMRRLFAEDPTEVEVMLDRRSQDRRGMAMSHEPERRRAERRRPGRAGDAIVAVGHAPSSELNYTPLNQIGRAHV